MAVYPLKDQQLKNWLVKRLQREELYCNNDALNFLAELVEGNLLAADQEITKLSLLYDKGEITLDNLFNAINDNARYKGFDLFDTVLKGQAKQVLSMLNSFQHDGTAIPWLLFIIAKEVRMLAIITAHQKHMPLSAAMAKTYIFAQRKALIENVLMRLSTDNNDNDNNNSFSWQDCLIQLSEVDKQSKGVITGNPWTTLSTLLVGISSHIDNLT